MRNNFVLIPTLYCAFGDIMNSFADYRTKIGLFGDMVFFIIICQMIWVTDRIIFPYVQKLKKHGSYRTEIVYMPNLKKKYG